MAAVQRWSLSTSVFSFLRQLTTWHCSHVCCWTPCCCGARHLPLSIDISPARRAHNSNPPHVAAEIDRWDRQADRRTDTLPLHRPCRILYAGSVNSVFMRGCNGLTNRREYTRQAIAPWKLFMRCCQCACSRQWRCRTTVPRKTSKNLYMTQYKRCVRFSRSLHKSAELLLSLSF